jgi:hypothetical protein
VELRGAQHARGHRPVEHQPLLQSLAGVVALIHAVDADDGEGDVVPDAGPLPGPQQVPGRRAEERLRGRAPHRRRVADVDDRLDPAQRVRQPGPGGQVHTGRPREHDRLVPGRAQRRRHMPPHHAGPAGHRDPHVRPPLRSALSPRTTQRPRA